MVKLPEMLGAGLSTLSSSTAGKGGAEALAGALTGGAGGASKSFGSDLASAAKAVLTGHAAPTEPSESYGKPGTDVGKLLGLVGGGEQPSLLGHLSKALASSAAGGDPATPASDSKGDGKGGVANALSKVWMLPIVSNTAGAIDKSDGSASGILKAAASGVLNTADGALEGAKAMAEKGSVNPIALGVGAGMGMLSRTAAAPDVVKNFSHMLVPPTFTS